MFRHITALAVAVVAFVFWAPIPKADCPHKGNKFHHEHCAKVVQDKLDALQAQIDGIKSGHFEFYDFTVSTTVGYVGGIAGMHAFCQTEFPELGTDVRFCTAEEYALSPEQALPDTPAWIHPSSDYF